MSETTPGDPRPFIVVQFGEKAPEIQEAPREPSPLMQWVAYHAMGLALRLLSGGHRDTTPRNQNDIEEG